MDFNKDYRIRDMITMRKAMVLGGCLVICVVFDWWAALLCAFGAGLYRFGEAIDDQDVI